MARVGRGLLLALLLAAYAVWGQFYIERTSFVNGGEQVFSLWDDAMISMRYARNLARGDGLVWNPGGERVQGFSNPGVTLVMAGVHLLPLSPAKTSLAIQWLNLVLLLGILVGCGRLARQLAPAAPGVAWAAMLGVAACAPLAVWSLQGSDVAFVALWMLGGALWVARSERRGRGWPRALPWLLAPGLLIRWDVAPLYAVFVAVSLWAPGARRRRLLAGAAAGGAVLGALVAASWLYYGDPLPNTFYLKATGTPLGLRLTAAVAQLGQWGWGLVAVGGLAGFALWERAREPAVLLVGALAAALLAYNLWIGGDWAVEYGSRFVVQALPLLLVLAAAGLGWLVDRLLPNAPAGLRAALCIAGVVWASQAAGPPEARQDWTEPRAETMYWHYNRENHLYASYLRQQTRPGTTLGLHSAGVPGYFSERPAVDLLGRSDRHIARMRVDRFEPGHAKWDWDYVVNQARPDVILFASRGLARRPDFRAAYLRVTRTGAPGWPAGGGPDFYLRRDARGALLDPGAVLRSLVRPGSADAAPEADAPGNVPAATASQLDALGYLSGYEPFPERTGVLVHARGRVAPGVNLILSGHADRASLMTLDGEVLHEWHADFRSLWPRRRVPPGTPVPHWRQVHLYPNGDLLAIYEGLGLVKLDRDSRLLWKRAGTQHHALQVAGDGRIYVLTYRRMRHPRFRPDAAVDVDFVSVLDPEGRPLRQVSILDAFLDSDYAPLLRGVPPGPDLFHANALEILDGRLAARVPALRAGDVLVSLRSLDLLAAIDMQTGRVVWTLAGPWRRQHDPTVLENGHLLLFDNAGGAGGFSRVLEVDPATGEITWAYEGNPANGFRSELRGASQRLPNGDTLITDSQHGRAFEVTRGGEIVWDFVNPERAREYPERIAVLYGVRRLPPGEIKMALDGSP